MGPVSACRRAPRRRHAFSSVHTVPRPTWVGHMTERVDLDELERDVTKAMQPDSWPGTQEAQHAVVCKVPAMVAELRKARAMLDPIEPEERRTCDICAVGTYRREWNGGRCSACGFFRKD